VGRGEQAHLFRGVELAPHDCHLRACETAITRQEPSPTATISSPSSHRTRARRCSSSSASAAPAQRSNTGGARASASHTRRPSAAKTRRFGLRPDASRFAAALTSYVRSSSRRACGALTTSGGSPGMSTCRSESGQCGRKRQEGIRERSRRGRPRARRYRAERVDLRGVRSQRPRTRRACGRACRA
jgi:hypothetical protein